MARNLKWTIPFKSLNGADCLVSIYVEGHTGSSTQLQGAADPFVFDEDDTDNLLDVIRVKTGFLRVIEENYGDLLDMHPSTNTTHYVTVKRSGYTVFTGFLQAQSFDTKWEPGPRVLEFPVMSPLGTMGGKDMPVPSSPSYITLASALKIAAETMDAGITSIMFPDYMLSSSARTLSLRINTLSYCPFNDYYSTAPNSDEPLYSPISVSQFIEAVCNCFGLMVHDMPGVLIFSRYDYNGTYTRYTLSNMETQDITSGATIVNLSNLATRGNDNMESNILPVHQLTINYDDDFFPDYNLPFGRCKTRYATTGEVILQPSTDEMSSNYLLTNYMPTPGVTGVAIGAYGELDYFSSLQEMVMFSVASVDADSTQIFKWKMYQVPKYFGYGCVLSMSMMVINSTEHKAENASKGLRIGIIMKNGIYYRQADGTWIATSAQYIDYHETDENGSVKIEYHQKFPDAGSPLEIIICAGDFRGKSIYGIADMNFSRSEMSFFQYGGRNLQQNYIIKNANGSRDTANIGQTINVARPSEDALIPPDGGYFINNHVCTYPYIFHTQHRFTIDTFIIPLNTHYLNTILIGNSVKKRIVCFGFDLWNDVVTITAQGSDTL